MSLTLSGTDGVVGAGFTLDSSGASVTAGVGTFGTLNVDDKIIHTGDTDTTIRFPGSDQISFETGGTQRMIIGSGGAIGITDSIQHTGDTNTKIRFPVNDTITAETGGVERLRIKSDGKIGIGTTTPSTTVDAIGTVRATSFTATQPEYLRVAHTDASHNQSLTDNTTHVLQFGSEYDDTKDGWTTGASNYYTIQETGYFLITSQAVITSNTANSLREWVLGVEQSTDSGSSWSVLLVNGGRGGGTDSTDTDTITPSLTLMHYLAAGTRIRVRVWANTDGGDWQVDEDLSDPLSGSYGGGINNDNQKGTRLFIMRLF